MIIGAYASTAGGEIGLEGFNTIVSHPAFADVSFPVEAPGASKKPRCEENGDRLKGVRGEMHKA